jgi:hypothetical protein
MKRERERKKRTVHLPFSVLEKRIYKDDEHMEKARTLVNQSCALITVDITHTINLFFVQS